MVKVDLDSLFEFVMKRKPVVITDNNFGLGDQRQFFELEEHLSGLKAQADKLKNRFDALAELRETHKACNYISYVIYHKHLY